MAHEGVHGSYYRPINNLYGQRTWCMPTLSAPPAYTSSKIIKNEPMTGIQPNCKEKKGGPGQEDSFPHGIQRNYFECQRRYRSSVLKKGKKEEGLSERPLSSLLSQ
ncbi:hypothetical protein PIIN_03705 [Serendipita indica DSM 11827]|uniref:Uncharacterized protein n=1 Tax=Serendipita indica (strain DSM 11827) TaxID=1109443 RepID=G4TEM2_SERID|nr:hypothetical protein PIIN_03705 [Serendipita indica DSM 11827]